jgi:hypothetical protein
MPRNRPTIRQWMHRYNELARQARQQGIFIREYRNLRVSNVEAEARVTALQARLDLMRTTAPTAIAVAQGEQGFGVEIEFYIPARFNMQAVATRLTQAGVQAVAELYNHATRGHWKLVTDGSLGMLPGFNAMELVSPVLFGENGLQQVQKACDVLTEMGATVNRKCGLHVHVGVTPANNNPDFFKRIVGIYRDHERHLDSVMAPSRRGSNNHFCKSLANYSAALLHPLNSVQQIIQLMSDRYVKLNLQSYWRHRTVEFRHHQGTTDGAKAVMWTRMCLKIVAAAGKDSFTPASDLTSFLDKIEATSDEQAFFLQRFAHFSSVAGQQE